MNIHAGRVARLIDFNGCETRMSRYMRSVRICSTIELVCALLLYLSASGPSPFFFFSFKQREKERGRERERARAVSLIGVIIVGG